MAINSWSDESYISPGPYLAKVVNHLDPTYMGGLEVTIIKAIPGLSETQSSNVIVKYCSPFFGQTSSKFEGNNSADFNDVQKSYGFWMVPPDIGPQLWSCSLKAISTKVIGLVAYRTYTRIK